MIPRFFCNDLQGKHIPVCDGRTNNQHDLTCNYGKPPCSPSAPAGARLPALVAFSGQHIEYGNGHGVRMIPHFDSPTMMEKQKEEVYILGRKLNRFHYLHSQPRSNHCIICSVQPTLEGEHWRLLSTAPCAAPATLPQTFLEVLEMWGNTWLWEHMTVTGGVS